MKLDAARSKGLAAFFFALSVVLFAALAGCARIDPTYPPREAQSIAAQAGLTPSVFRAERFAIWGAYRLSQPGGPLRVYFEGDGLNFIDAYTPSTDPTPLDPLALKLAARDPAPNLLYLSRPCQYHSLTGQEGCSFYYWTTFRYAPEIIEALDQAVAQVEARGRTTMVTLVGHSGGGTVAALLAARRSNVKRLATVAANIDHVAWTKLDDSTPLRGSLNPPDFAAQLAKVSQVHLVGDRDSIVPPSVVDAYRRALPASADVEIVRFPQYDHVCCWEENWPAFVARWLDRP
jgi:hypothetical protein